MDTKVGAIVTLILFGAAATPLASMEYLPTAEQSLTFLIEKETALVVSSYLFGLASVALVWVTSRLRSHIGDSEGAGTAAVTGAGLAAVAMLVGPFIAIPQAARAAAGELDAMLATVSIDLLSVGLGNVAAYGFALIAVGLGFAGMRSGRLPRWIVVSGFALAAVLLTPIQWAAGLIVPIWLVATAFLVRTDDRVKALV